MSVLREAFPPRWCRRPCNFRCSDRPRCRRLPQPGARRAAPGHLAVDPGGLFRAAGLTRKRQRPSRHGRWSPELLVPPLRLGIYGTSAPSGS